MKKFSLTVGEKEYQVIGESLDSIEMWAKDGTPKVWADNLSNVVVTDLTEQISKNESMRKKRALFDSLIADEEILDNLIADLKSRKAPTDS